MNKNKPIPNRLSQWGTGTEIIYHCRNCGQSFHILGRQEIFCHNCGIELDWKDRPKYCSEEFKKLYDDLVYKKFARMTEDRPQDIELLSLLYSLDKGDIS